MEYEYQCKNCNKILEVVKDNLLSFVYLVEVCSCHIKESYNEGYAEGCSAGKDDDVYCGEHN